MTGNATFCFDNTSILSVCGVDAPRVVTSAEFDERLAETYRRVGLRTGLLEGLAGIVERRWWPQDVSFSDAAAMAGAKALAEAGVDPSEVGLLIDTSVSRAHLEPSAAVAVHAALGLGTSCLNFDLANACLGFLNGMQLAATMIDAGRIAYALVVDGEGARYTHEVTLARLARPDATRDDVLSQFATLTLGSGAAAMVLGRPTHPEGHRIVGGVMRAETEHHELCIGDLESMQTDAKGLLDAGMALSRRVGGREGAFRLGGHGSLHRPPGLAAPHEGDVPDRGHRRGAGTAHVPDPGNMGPATIPFTLATQLDSLRPDHRVLLMGAGSGMNAACMEVVW